MITTDYKIRFTTGRQSQKRVQGGSQQTKRDAGRVPHVSKLMALAIRLDQLIRDGGVADQAELARLGHVSRARLTQIMNLLHLSPDLQEEILFLPPNRRGRSVIAERDLRPIAATPSWNKQRKMWATALPALASATSGPAFHPHRLPAAGHDNNDSLIQRPLREYVPPGSSAASVQGVVGR